MASSSPQTYSGQPAPLPTPVLWTLPEIASADPLAPMARAPSVLLQGLDLHTALSAPEDPRWQSLIHVNDAPWALFRPFAFREANRLVERARSSVGLHTPHDVLQKEFMAYKSLLGFHSLENQSMIDQLVPDELRLETPKETDLRTTTLFPVGWTTRDMTPEIRRRADLLQPLSTRECHLRTCINELAGYTRPTQDLPCYAVLWRLGYSNALMLCMALSIGNSSYHVDMDLEANLLYRTLAGLGPVLSIPGSFYTLCDHLMLCWKAEGSVCKRARTWLYQLPFSGVIQLGHYLHSCARTAFPADGALCMVRQFARPIFVVNQSNVVGHLLSRGRIPLAVIQYHIQPFLHGVAPLHSPCILTWRAPQNEKKHRAEEKEGPFSSSANKKHRIA